MNAPSRRTLLTAAVTAPVALTSPVASAADAEISNAFAAWEAVREAARALHLPDDPSDEHDAECTAAWVVEREAGERLARLTATTPNGAALQLRWLHARLREGTLPNEAEGLLARLADTLAAA